MSSMTSAFIEFDRADTPTATKVWIRASEITALREEPPKADTKTPSGPRVTIITGGNSHTVIGETLTSVRKKMVLANSGNNHLVQVFDDKGPVT